MIVGRSVATFLTLLLVPVVYSLLDDLEAWVKVKFGRREVAEAEAARA